MIADAEWALLVVLLDALARHFSSLRIINRDRELHTAYVAYLRHIEATNASQE